MQNKCQPVIPSTDCELFPLVLACQFTQVTTNSFQRPQSIILKYFEIQLLFFARSWSGVSGCNVLRGFLRSLSSHNVCQKYLQATQRCLLLLLLCGKIFKTLRRKSLIQKLEIHFFAPESSTLRTKFCCYKSAIQGPVVVLTFVHRQNVMIDFGANGFP